MQALCMPDLYLHPKKKEGSKRTEGSSVRQCKPELSARIVHNGMRSKAECARSKAIIKLSSLELGY